MMAVRQHLLSDDDLAGTLADYERVLRENEHLQAVVADLRDRLAARPAPVSHVDPDSAEQ
jgi:hypothetical protein